MATVQGLTKERMLSIENASIVGGRVDANKHLILTTKGGTEIDAGLVEGPQGVPGMPAGTISLWVSDTIPSGWIEADGRAVSRFDYSDLFSIIGSKYGNGDGANTFNVPDLRGKVVVGQDVNDAAFDTLNKFGGEKTHLLTVDEMPNHTHSFTYNGGTYGSWPLLGSETSLNKVGFATGDDYSPARSIAINAVGGNKAHNVMQPYRVLKYIIKGIGGVGTLTSTVESALLDRTAAVELETDALQVDMQVAKGDIQGLKTAPAFHAGASANQSASGTSTWRKLLFASETVDRGDCYDPNLSRFTAPVSGFYELTVTVTPSTSSAGPGFRWYRNGVPIASVQYDMMAYYDAYKSSSVSRIFDLAAGEYMEMWWNNLNDSAVTLSSTYGTWFSGKMV